MIDETYLALAGVAATIFILKKIVHNFYLYALINLPGTFLHELSHWLASFFLGGRPAGIGIWPRRTVHEDGSESYELGSVTSYNVRWYNGLFIGLAPLSLAVAAWWIFQEWGAGARDWKELAVSAVICGLLLEASIPSTQDLKVAFKSSWAALIILGLLYLFFPEIDSALGHNLSKIMEELR